MFRFLIAGLEQANPHHAEALASACDLALLRATQIVIHLRNKQQLK